MFLRFSIREADKTFRSHTRVLIEFSPSARTSNRTNKTGFPLTLGKSLSIYIKIFLNYSQTIAIIHNLELNWPSYVDNYLQIASNIGSVSTQFLSLECLISDFKMNINAIYLKAVASIFIYLVFLVSSASIFLIRKLLMKGIKEFNKFIILAIVLSIIMQPNSIKQTSDIFNCLKVGSHSYLIQEMSVECWTTEHVYCVIYYSYLIDIYLVLDDFICISCFFLLGFIVSYGLFILYDLLSKKSGKN